MSRSFKHHSEERIIVEVVGEESHLISDIYINNKFDLHRSPVAFLYYCHDNFGNVRSVSRRFHSLQEFWLELRILYPTFIDALEYLSASNQSKNELHME